MPTDEVKAMSMSDANAVRAYVAAKWPKAMQSPLAVSVRQFVAHDEADRAVGFAMLQADATAAEAAQVRTDAMERARACLDACDGWTIETFGHNIESAFGDDLTGDECDEIARAVLARSGVES